MIDAPPLVAIDAGADGCVATLAIPPDLACLRGHFPGHPVVPGVVLVGWALELAATHLGMAPDCRGMETLKFQRVLQPGQRVELTLRADRDRHTLRFAYRDGDTMCASGRMLPPQANGQQIAEAAPSGGKDAPLPWPIAELIPHRDGMLLLDALAACDADHVRCRYRVPPGGLLHDASGTLPAWAGVELMAQAAAAWAGCQATRASEPVRRGFLLGTRHYTCNVAGFAPGNLLMVEARHTFSDANGMGMFACRILAPGVLAEARLAVFSPPESPSRSIAGPIGG